MLSSSEMTSLDVFRTLHNKVQYKATCALIDAESCWAPSEKALCRSNKNEKGVRFVRDEAKRTSFWLLLHGNKAFFRPAQAVDKCDDSLNALLPIDALAQIDKTRESRETFFLSTFRSWRYIALTITYSRSFRDNSRESKFAFSGRHPLSQAKSESVTKPIVQ